jgi:hypothetical protein
MALEILGEQKVLVVVPLQFYSGRRSLRFAQSVMRMMGQEKMSDIGMDPAIQRKNCVGVRRTQRIMYPL